MQTHNLVPALVACCIAVGCTGNDESSTDRGSAPTTVADAAGTSRSACELLTAEEVAAVHGEPVEARPGDVEGPNRSTCVYAPPGSEWEVMWLTVHWRGGKEEWETQQAGRGIGTRMLSNRTESADALTRPDPLAGIGDAAYYGGLLPSLVLKDDVLIEVMMPLLENDREHFPELARKALSRL